MPMTVDVGVVGMPGEAHAAFLVQRLPFYGARPLLIDPAPSAVAGLSLADDEARYGGIPLTDIPVFYLRSLYAGAVEQPNGDADWRTVYAAGRERQGLWVSWLRGADRRGHLVVNTVDANDLHSLKPYTLHLLREAGVPVPATLVTSDGDALRDFLGRHRQVICKPVAGGALARLVTEDDLSPDRLAVLRLAPVLFQEYIPGRDLRVYTLDGRPIAAGVIHTDEVDYRTAEGPVELVQPEAEAESLAVRAATATGCRFCAVDLKWTADGGYVVLDCNPSPMFLGFDRKSGATVGERLAEFLAARARRA